MNMCLNMAICAFVFASGHVFAIDAVPAMDHSHTPIEVPDDVAAPAMALSVSVDAVSGFNLAVQLDNYLLSPPPDLATMAELMGVEIDSASGMLTGHAHLYVNGKKIQRVYGKYVHLPATLFNDGVNQVSVTINNHGHMYWTVAGKKVIATTFINTDKAQPVLYSFASFPPSSN